MKTCLLVIDVQESFRHRDYFSEADVGPYLIEQNRLIAGAIAKGIPVVRVLHSDGPPVASNPWSHESGYIVPLRGLIDFTPAQTVYKEKHSALVGTGLEAWLREKKIERIIVSGIRTEQCCETTTRHASDIGFAVNYCLDATLTFEMQLPDGKPFTVADIKARTATVLKDRFANIVSVEQALQNVI